MKSKLIYFVGILSLVFLLGFISAENVNTTNMSLDKEQASQMINDSEVILSQMMESNFSILYVNDTLNDAKRAFEIARYAEILRSGNSTAVEKQEANRYLALINWNKANYSDIVPYVIEIKNRQTMALDISDSLNVLQNQINEYSSRGINVSKLNNLLNQSREAFYNDRYAEAVDAIKSTLIEFENERAQLGTTSIIKNNTFNFIKRNWPYILIVIILLSVLGYSNYHSVKRKILKNRIESMKKEKEILINLIKKTQEERFKQNTISGLVYNIRSKKYEERLNDIKQELPILERKLIFK